ncbi:MAG: hypothetical protein WAM14_09720 [Candidatus Nitrosopolaris sp.]
MVENMLIGPHGVQQIYPTKECGTEFYLNAKDPYRGAPTQAGQRRSLIFHLAKAANSHLQNLSIQHMCYRGSFILTQSAANIICFGRVWQKCPLRCLSRWWQMEQQDCL